MDQPANIPDMKNPSVKLGEESRCGGSDPAVPGAQHEMQHWLTTIAATVPGVICSFRLRPDGSTCMPYASAALSELYGLQPAEVRNDAAPIFSRIFVEDLEHIRETIDLSAREMTPWRAEFRVQHPTKGLRWIEGHSMPQKESDGGIVWHGFLQDITERREMESTLRESERIYRAIGETIDYGIWICAPDGANLYASESFLNLVGLTQEQCSSFGWGDVLHPDDAERTISAWKECVRTGSVWDIEHRFRGRDGLWHDILARGIPVRNERGEISHWAGINLDISGRKRAEKLLRDSEADLRRAQVVAQTGSWRLDVQRNELIWSDENHKIFGIPKGKPLTYETFLSVVHPQDIELVSKSWLAALQGEPYDIEHRIVVGGETKWVRERAELEFHADGTLQGGFGSTQDITERKRTEAALSASESRFRLAMEAVAGVVYDWDRYAGTIYWSSGLSRIFGFEELDPKLSRRWWDENVHPDDLHSIRKEILRCLKTNAGQFELEYRIRHSAGHWVYVSDRAQILREASGKVVRLVGSLADISARKNAEAALREVNDSLEDLVARRTAEAESRARALVESERFAHATIDALDSALCVLDSQGCIVAVNKAWREFARANGGQVNQLCEGSNYLAACDAAAASFPVAATVAGAIREALAGTRQDFSIEYDCDSPEERRWFHMNLSCFPGEGPIRLVIKHENITARKLAEEDQQESSLRLKQLAAHLETVREEQSATIAREVHDELGGTLTMVKLGLATIAVGLPEPGPGKESLVRILKLVDVALQTVKRISADLRPATLDTLGLVATIRWYAAQFSEVTGIETELRLPEYVQVSQNQGMAMFRIIQEALTNVAKHADASTVCISMRKAKGQWSVKITDDGCGMTGTHRNNSHSFGLIGMHERARYLGGQLSISGHPGKGTSLNLRIPIDDQMQKGDGA